jgi:acyl-CoA reductase-like NAD-dependent aldehyde dehydrogenase
MSEIAKHWIDGERTGSGTLSESVNPATGAVLGRRAAINDGFAEGGYKQSGTGRLRGPLAITEFTEAKTVVYAIPPFQV